MIKQRSEVYPAHMNQAGMVARFKINILTLPQRVIIYHIHVMRHANRRNCTEAAVVKQAMYIAFVSKTRITVKFLMQLAQTHFVSRRNNRKHIATFVHYAGYLKYSRSARKR
jgi:hypothetical protein